MIIRYGQREHEDGHEDETHQLYEEATEVVDERDGEPVARYGAAESDESLSSGDGVDFVDCVHCLGGGNPSYGAVYVFLEEVAAVIGDVEEEPCRGCADEVEAVTASEFFGE